MTHVHLHQTRFPSIFVCPAVFVKQQQQFAFTHHFKGGNKEADFVKNS